MTVEDVRELFSAVPMLARKLQTLMNVGLSYIRLDQSATPAKRCTFSTNR
jgi:excinuclease ABC subunit A